MSVSTPSVRAFYTAANVPAAEPPFDCLHIKVYYPCAYGNSFEENNTGFIPADSSKGPFPIVILMPGTNLSPEAYSWLAHTLCEQGFAVATFTWVGREVQDLVSITPGVDLETLKAENYGQAASCTALQPLLDKLVELNTEGILANLLDMQSIVLGGHSAGGTMALLNANPNWFPGIVGGFSYAAHVAANAMLGWEDSAFLPLHPQLPFLLMGGSRDGVIAASAHRYGENANNSPTERIQSSFEQAIPGESGDRHLLIIEGANHFSFSGSADTATGRAYLDMAEEGDASAIKHYLGDTIAQFCLASCGRENHIEKLIDPTHPLAAIATSK